MLRTLNNITRTLLFQAHIPPSYWVEALNMAAHLLNILPSTAINNEIPFTKLHNKPPTYDHLRVFGCLCYPHISFDHKLQPRSTTCVFLGYPLYIEVPLQLTLSTNKIIISRHVIFDEDQFPFGSMTPDTPPSYDFLLPPHNTHTSQTTHPNNHQLHPPTAMPPSPTHTSPTQSPQAQPQSPHHPLTPRTPATHQQISGPPLSSAHEPTTQAHSEYPITHHCCYCFLERLHYHISTPIWLPVKAGISKPLESMNCHATTTSPIPRSHLHALRDPHWHKVMVDEYNALISNGTWALVPSQQQGIDCDETFSPVVKPATICTVLSLASDKLIGPNHQLDVKNLLHGLRKYLYAAHMQHCNPCKTPETLSPTRFQMHISLYMHDPRDPHFTALKRILRYVRRTIDHGTTVLPPGIVCTLGDNHLSRSAKRQVTLTRSRAEANIRGVCECCCNRSAWIRNLLLELRHSSLLRYSCPIVIM
ncbi:ribonuclease H-like domain-containing protein [Tanacetum coccineum]|uniref:Ribonuclease H-like domain-containing protein n=1 Tax=Tanacetum coccineum TaxID=301880 RepID=A0ABQ4XBY7_9ASTR